MARQTGNRSANQEMEYFNKRVHIPVLQNFKSLITQARRQEEIVIQAMQKRRNRRDHNSSDIQIRRRVRIFHSSTIEQNDPNQCYQPFQFRRQQHIAGCLHHDRRH